MFLVMTMLYYIVAASAVLFYGIGINRTVAISGALQSVVLSCFKSLSAAAATTAMGFLAAQWFLVDVQLAELFPFLTVVLFLIFTLLVEIFVGVGFEESPLEFSVPLLSTILALGEGLTLAHAVLIVCSCILSFYLLLVLFHSIRERVSFYSTEGGLRTYCVVLISLAAIILAVSGWNVSWFTFVLRGVGN